MKNLLTKIVMLLVLIIFLFIYNWNFQIFSTNKNDRLYSSVLPIPPTDNGRRGI